MNILNKIKENRLCLDTEINELKGTLKLKQIKSEMRKSNLFQIAAITRLNDQRHQSLNHEYDKLD